MSDAASSDETCTVRVEPLGASVVCRRGEPLMQAALRSGFRWPTVCGGAARCGVCFVRVCQSSGELPPIAAKEAGALKLVPTHVMGTDIRLACQLAVMHDMVVERRGVVPPDNVDDRLR